MDSVKVAGWIAVAVSLVLSALAFLTTPPVIIIIVPALLGGLVVVLWPWRRSALIVALLLIGSTAAYSMIGGIGLLYVPSLLLILLGTVRIRRVPAGQRDWPSAPRQRMYVPVA